MMDVTNSPFKISCLCVTRNRVELLKKSIRMFENQTWPHKELVIVYVSNDKATKDFLESINNTNIKSVEVTYDPQLTLGDLRNISVSEARGDYICIWDDDDWFHPERLRIQMNDIMYSGKKACALLNLLMLDNTTKKVYLSSQRLWEASIMCERKFILGQDLFYPSVNQREDTYFMKKLRSFDAISGLQNPKMYIYCYSGTNTCSESHFKMLFSLGRQLPAAMSERIAHIYNRTEQDVAIASILDELFARAR